MKAPMTRTVGVAQHRFLRSFLSTSSTHLHLPGICKRPVRLFRPHEWTCRTSSTLPLPPPPPLNITNASMLQVLREQVALGNIRSDKAQERVAKRLSRLQQALIDYDNDILFQSPVTSKEENEEKEGSEASGTVGSMLNASTTGNDENQEPPQPPPPPRLKIPRGLYIHGPVGTGKSMLMDTFYDHVPVQKKARYHFHSFLAQVHQEIHQLKQQDLKEHGRNFAVDTSIENNPIHRVGLQLSQSTSLLCLDEFQVTDIADAVILSQLFGVLFHKGTVVVATSNRPPQDLYEGGLNRSYFLPFIDLLERHCIVHAIQSDVDYRRALASCSYFFGSAKALETVLEEVIENVVGADLDHPKEFNLPVGFQRTFWIDRSYESPSSPTLKACRLDFVQVCDSDVGAQDYRAIAQHFDIVCLEDVQAMNLQGHNRARRFITLIDELYEAKCCLFLSTSRSEDMIASPMELFRVVTKDGNADDSESDLETILGIDVSSQGGTAVGALASVRELEFAFERASSRIVEMCSRSWWDKRLSLEKKTT